MLYNDVIVYCIIYNIVYRIRISVKCWYNDCSVKVFYNLYPHTYYHVSNLEVYSLELYLFLSP